MDGQAEGGMDVLRHVRMYVRIHARTDGQMERQTYLRAYTYKQSICTATNDVQDQAHLAEPGNSTEYYHGLENVPHRKGCRLAKRLQSTFGTEQHVSHPLASLLTFQNR